MWLKTSRERSGKGRELEKGVRARGRRMEGPGRKFPAFENMYRSRIHYISTSR